MMLEIREEHPDDVAAIRDVNRRAFGQDQEGNIVEALRSTERRCSPSSQQSMIK